MRRTLLSLLVAPFLPAALSAQATIASISTPKPTRAESREAALPTHATATAASASRATIAPVIDGKGNDAAWQDAQIIDHFLEYDPNEGKESRFKTEVRVTYDDKNLYVLARMYDPAPDSIVSLLSRRDVRTASEQLKLVIDSYHDRKTAFEFIVNPAGVKRDFYMSNDGNDEDASWDAVWDVATSIDSLGWVAEFKIPFSQIRFAPGDEHTFGLIVGRDIARTGERLSWPLIRRKVQGYVSQAGELSGIGALPSPRRLEIMPYTVAKNGTRDYGTVRPGLGRYDHPNNITVGGDIKYGLSSNLTLDATVNPDFGQVEADPAQLNLTAFESFFEERRPFFLEGAGIFTFNTNCGDIDSGCTGLFYSRRIGRSPQLAGSFGDATSPTSTPIATAAKLTGRLANGISIGVLDAVTERVDGVQNFSGQNAAIEPRTNYGVFRLARDNSDGQGDLGVMLTTVNRSLDPGAIPLLRSSAYVGGVDMRRRFWSRNYEMRSFVAMSDVSGSAASIASLQTNTVHAYQRPDDALAFDPTRTSLRGDAERISVSKFGGGITRFQSVYQRYSPGFESNDLGYQQRADEQLFRNWFALQFNTPTKYYQRLAMNFNAFGDWTTGGLTLGNGVNQNDHVQWKNFWWTHVGVNLNDYGTAYNDRAARGGPAIRKSPSQSFWAGIQSDSRRLIQGSTWVSAARGDDGHSFSGNVSPQVDFQVSSRFAASIGTSYSRNGDDQQFYGQYGANGADSTHYTFARLDQTTVSFNSRLNFTATPNLTFQLYAEPFVSSGTYADWKQIANARADQFVDRFKAYGSQRGVFDGFTYRQFNSNAVLRYEYRPGSTLFVVWQQGRTNYLTPGDQDYNPSYRFQRDYGSALRDHPNNTLLVKLSYWLNP